MQSFWMHCGSVAMDSPLSSPAKVDVPVCATTAEEAEPSPRFITSEELHILQTCLTRWRTEVEQDIKGIVAIYSWLPPKKEEVNVFTRVCLSVCLSVSKISQKRVHGFGEMLHDDRCRDMDELEPIWIIVQMPEPDCFLWYRISAATWNFASGKFHVYVLAARCCSEAWFSNVLFTEPSEHLCRRYMRSTECPSSCVV